MLIKLSGNVAINPEFLSYIVEETTGIDRVRRITVIVFTDGRKLRIDERASVVMEKLGIK